MIIETEALRIAEQALGGLENAGPPYTASLNDGVWLVATTPVSGLGFAVRIDGTTGRASVEAFQSATIDESL